MFSLPTAAIIFRCTAGLIYFSVPWNIRIHDLVWLVLRVFFYPQDWSGRRLKPIAYLTLIPRLKTSGVMTPLPSYTFKVCIGTSSHSTVIRSVPFFLCKAHSMSLVTNYAAAILPFSGLLKICGILSGCWFCLHENAAVRPCFRVWKCWGRCLTFVTTDFFSDPYAAAHVRFNLLAPEFGI